MVGIHGKYHAHQGNNSEAYRDGYNRHCGGNRESEEWTWFFQRWRVNSSSSDKWKALTGSLPTGRTHWQSSSSSDKRKALTGSLLLWVRDGHSSVYRDMIDRMASDQRKAGHPFLYVFQCLPIADWNDPMWCTKDIDLDIWTEMIAKHEESSRTWRQQTW